MTTQTLPTFMVAPNGAKRKKADHPQLPISIEEMVYTSRACFEAGANALHLHIRDDEGNHSLDPGKYKEALRELEKAVPEMPVQITTEAVGVYSVEDQLNCLDEVKPNWASISIREIACNPSLAQKVYATCEDNQTAIQHILYDSEDANLLAQWLGNGTIKQHQNSVLLVLGRYTKGQTSNKGDIKSFLSSLPSVSDWMLCAFGKTEHECLLAAAQLGGNCRVGFENSLENKDGEQWADNAASVSALYKLLENELN